MNQWLINVSAVLYLAGLHRISKWLMSSTLKRMGVPSVIVNMEVCWVRGPPKDAVVTMRVQNAWEDRNDDNEN